MTECKKKKKKGSRFTYETEWRWNLQISSSMLISIILPCIAYIHSEFKWLLWRLEWIKDRIQTNFEKIQKITNHYIPTVHWWHMTDARLYVQRRTPIGEHVKHLTQFNISSLECWNLALIRQYWLNRTDILKHV